MKQAKVLVFLILGLALSFNLALAWDMDGILQEWEFGSELRPYDIVTLSDGSPWLTHEEAGEAGKVFTVNLADGTAVVYTAPFTAHFHTVDRAADDTLWIADYTDRLVHFDPFTGVFTPHPLDPTEFTLPSSPYGVSVAPDGKVWFTCWGDACLGVYDPGADTWERFGLPSGGSYPPGVPVEIAFGNDRPVWFTIREWGPGYAGFGCLEPDTGDFTLWTDPSLFFPDHCCPVPVEFRLRTPWGIATSDLGGVYDFVWFTDKSANYIIEAEIVPAPLITRYPTPDPEILDSHFFALDPDGVSWLAAYGSHRIATYSRAGHAFESLPLTTTLHPMGIAVSPIGEVWWAAAGNHIAGTEMGAGRFIPFADADGDGMDDGIDTEPAVPSSDFSDGATTGLIIDPGDQELTIVDATDPHGIRIIATCSGGEDPAFITVCPPTIRRITLTACDEILVTCGSATIQVLAGPVEIELSDSIMVTVPTGAKVTITEIADDTFEIENSGKAGTIIVEFLDEVMELEPGEGLLVEPGINKLCSFLGDDRWPSWLDQDIYTFEGSQGETVTVRLEAELSGSHVGERATLILRDRIHRVWLFRIDRSALPNEITVALPASGRYDIVVAEQPRFVRGKRFRGDYCLTLESTQDAWQTLEPTHWVE